MKENTVNADNVDTTELLNRYFIVIYPINRLGSSIFDTYATDVI